MIYGADLVIRDLGALLPGGGTLELGWFAVPFTVFVTVGIINAVNLSDGLDGLCGNLTLVSLLGLGAAGSLFGHPQISPLINVLSAAVAGFLIFNQRMIWQPKAAVFLGDAGSTLLGFALAWVLVEVSQEPYRAISPAVALWFVVVPVFDTVAAIVRRMADGLSPLSPDTRHLHHLLIKSGFSVSKTIAVLCLLALQGVAVGLLATWFGWSEPLMALILFATWVLFTLYIRRAVEADRRAGTAAGLIAAFRRRCLNSGTQSPYVRCNKPIRQGIRLCGWINSPVSFRWRWPMPSRSPSVRTTSSSSRCT